MDNWIDGMNCAAGICADKTIELQSRMDSLSDADRIEAMAVIIGVMAAQTDILRAIIKEQGKPA